MFSKKLLHPLQNCFLFGYFPDIFQNSSEQEHLWNAALTNINLIKFAKSAETSGAVFRTQSNSSAVDIRLGFKYAPGYSFDNIEGSYFRKKAPL